MKYITESNDFPFPWGFKMQRKCVSLFWNFGNLALENFGNIFKGVCMKLFYKKNVDKKLKLKWPNIKKIFEKITRLNFQA